MPSLPEIAFAGRSNVGKSSLLNALTGRRALARVSHEPGRTRQLNFFDLGGRLILVDMPGYGYARAGKAVKQDWQGLMFDYLRGRTTLRRVMLLLDARIEMKPADGDGDGTAGPGGGHLSARADQGGWGEAGGAGAEARRGAGRWRARHPAAYPDVMVTSSETGQGIEALRAAILTAAQ